MLRRTATTATSYVGLRRASPAHMSASSLLRAAYASASVPTQTLWQSLTNRTMVSTKKSEATKVEDPHINELRMLTISPGHLKEYVTVSEKFLEHKTKEGAKLLGYWNVTLGECTNEVVQIWQWESHKHRQTAHQNLAKNPAWEEYTKTVKPMIQHQKYSIVLQFPFWPFLQPESNGGIYELRTYHLIPGAVWVWGNYWEQGLKHRSKYVQPVCAWYTEIGLLNTVYHLWRYDDMDQRRRLREAVWDEPGWAEIVELTHPLIKEMDSRILTPTKASPLQ